MKTSIQGMMEIASHEGIVQMPYKDSVGVWTWGIGHTAAAGEPNPALMTRGRAVDLERVFDVFRRDLAKYEAGVNRAFTRSLKQHQFDAAVSFHYNTGSIAKATWVKLFNAGNEAAAARAIMNWGKPPEIIPRRQKEQKLFRDGAYSSGGFANVYPANTSGTVLWSRGKRMDLRSIFEADPKPNNVPIVDWKEGGLASLTDKPPDRPVETEPSTEPAPQRVFSWPWLITSALFIAVVGFIFFRILL